MKNLKRRKTFGRIKFLLAQIHERKQCFYQFLYGFSLRLMVAAWKSKFSTECCNLLQQQGYQDNTLAKKSLRKGVEAIWSTLSPLQTTQYFPAMFSIIEKPSKSCELDWGSGNLCIGSRFRDVQHYQVSCIGTYRKEFPQHNSPKWLWRALPTNVPKQVFKPVKNNFLATLLKSCSKTSAQAENQTAAVVTHVVSFKNYSLPSPSSNT